MIRQPMAALALMVGIGVSSVSQAAEFPTGTFKAMAGKDMMALKFEDKGRFILA